LTTPPTLIADKGYLIASTDDHNYGIDLQSAKTVRSINHGTYGFDVRGLARLDGASVGLDDPNLYAMLRIDPATRRILRACR
jgi:hypothetical protein